MLIIFLPFWRYISTQECKLAGWRGGRGVNSQSWAHRSYKLSERSKAMSDLWFSEWKKMSVERWANCQKKEFAHRSKRSLNLKERAFCAVRSLSDVSMLNFLGAVFSIKVLPNEPMSHYWKQDTCPISILFPTSHWSRNVCWGLGEHIRQTAEDSDLVQS